MGMWQCQQGAARVVGRDKECGDGLECYQQPDVRGAGWRATRTPQTSANSSLGATCGLAATAMFDQGHKHIFNIFQAIYPCEHSTYVQKDVTFKKESLSYLQVVAVDY